MTNYLVELSRDIARNSADARGYSLNIQETESMLRPLQQNDGPVQNNILRVSGVACDLKSAVSAAAAYIGNPIKIIEVTDCLTGETTYRVERFGDKTKFADGVTYSILYPQRRP